MLRKSHRGETHGDEAGERRGFEEAAVRRLDALQHAQGAPPGERPRQPQQRISSRRVMVDRLADGDQRGQRIAHHRQTQGSEELVRKGGQLERERACTKRHSSRPASAQVIRIGTEKVRSFP